MTEIPRGPDNSRQTLISGALLGLLSAAGCALVAVRYAYTGRPAHFYLIWNLFLAWIPLVAAIGIDFIRTNTKSKKFGIMVTLGALWFLWFIFYPNAPYMITDFIHLTGGRGLIVWYDFIIFAIFATSALIIGFVSLFLAQTQVTDGFKAPIRGWIFVIASSYLTGFGIYLGRIVRWNSWDVIFNPIVLVRDILDSFHFVPLTFSLLFGTFLCLTYFAMYSLTRLRQH